MGGKQRRETLTITEYDMLPSVAGAIDLAYLKLSRNPTLVDTINVAEGMKNKILALATHIVTTGKQMKEDNVELSLENIERTNHYRPASTMADLYYVCMSKLISSKDTSISIIFKYIVFLYWLEYYDDVQPEVFLGEVKKSLSIN